MDRFVEVCSIDFEVDYDMNFCGTICLNIIHHFGDQ
jgi:hypothetical protein